MKILKIKNNRQKTIKKPIKIEGIGIHTGKLTKLNIDPSKDNHGIVFILNGTTKVLLHPDNVIGKPRGTSLIKDHEELKTIEHFLAAVSALGITNLQIKVTGKEIPILDGTAKKWIELFERAQIIEQKSFQDIINIHNQITIYKNKKFPDEGYIKVTPANTFSIDCKVDFPIIGKQTAYYDIDKTNFSQEIAPARTFGFEWELATLKEKGLAKGASLDNALLISEDGFSSDLNFPNEPAKHKLLDLIGDIATLGKPLNAHIEAFKPGHILNIKSVKTLIATAPSSTNSNLFL